MGFPFLACRAVAAAIHQDRFQAIEVGAAHIDATIDDDTSQVLSHAVSHDSCFAVMHDESLFSNRRRNVDHESLNTSGKIGVAGKRQVVSVTGVVPAGELALTPAKRQSRR